MAELEQSENNKIFLSIIQGSLKQAVPEGTEGAVKREWEAGGNSGVKWEKSYTAINGKIKNVTFYDGESGGRKFQSLNVVLDEVNGKTPVISIGVGTRYAQDILKKLPNIDFDEEVRIRPYSFQPEGEDKNVTGVEITQKDGIGQFNKKITSFFHKKNGDNWENINGFPNPEGDTSEYTSDDWDIYYKQVRKFLVTYTKENISTKFEADSEETKKTESSLERPPSIDLNDIPF